MGMWRAPRIGGVPINKKSLASITQAAKDITAGRYAPTQIIKHRLDVCKTCIYKDENRCNACGCFLKTKTALLNSKCPMLKW